MTNREEWLARVEKDYENRLYKNRKRSARGLYFYVILLILTVVSTIINGFTWQRLFLFGAFIFIIAIALHNKKVLKKEDVVFKTEYMEKENDYIDHDYDEESDKKADGSEYLDDDY